MTRSCQSLSRIDQGELAAGVNVFDASATASAGELTLGELHLRYIEEHSKPHKRTWQDDVALFRRHWQRWRRRR